MNRTLKEATVRRYHYDSHDQLRDHLANFLAAYNFAKRLKTLRGLTPHEYICKCWTENPDQFRLNPFHHKLGLNTYGMDASSVKGSGGSIATYKIVRRNEAGRPEVIKASETTPIMPGDIIEVGSSKVSDKMPEKASDKTSDQNY